MTAFDVIGDIHGQAGKLEALLGQMGYARSGRGYKAPLDRQAVFLGDLIDRGPEQALVLEVARSMVESGNACCILGNHEFNAIGYVTEDPATSGDYLRPNQLDTPTGRKNREQHADFLAQIGQSTAAHKAWVEWFKTLPPCIDLGGIRVVHGCWDDASVNLLGEAGWREGGHLSDAVLIETYREGSPIKYARQLLTCGLELPLPQGAFILDKSGHMHHEVRVANWRDWATQIHEVALVPEGHEEQLKGMEWPAELVISAIEGAPIFVGHHWFTGHPVIESPKLACLGWSAGKGGSPVKAFTLGGFASRSSAVFSALAEAAWLEVPVSPKP